MFINRKFINRHKILEALQLTYKNNWRPDDLDTDEIELSWNQLKEATGLNDEEILGQIDFLLINEEIFNNDIDYNSSYLILQKGTTSYYDQKYLTIGKKEYKENLYDILKLISGIVLLLIAISTFVKNLVITEKNSKEIEILKRNIQDLKSINTIQAKENEKIKK